MPFLKKSVLGTLLVLGYAVQPAAAYETGTLSDNQVIESRVLGYKLQYRVYLPAGYKNLSGLPVLYVTDGQWYIDQGEMPAVLDDLIARGEIAPLIAVFVDNRDPDNLSNNRRNRQFFCNQDYIRFFMDELTAEVDGRYKTQADRDGRVILGLSFGGLNSACFGLYAHEAFGGIAMQSPAMHPVRGLFGAYEEAPKRDLRIFLSTGTFDDNEARTRRFKQILEAKGYMLGYVEVPHAHNWQNWKPLLDDVLLHFFNGQ